MSLQKELYENSIEFLKDLIKTPSFSGEEQNTVILIENWFKKYDISFERENNNIWAQNKHFNANKPTILLNSHHDTVKPNSAYTNDPFDPKVENGILYGLGSNDAGGCLVALISLFTYYHEKENLKYNLIMAATAEEENSGSFGLNSILNHLPEIAFAVVGEPTQMQLAIAEKGLLVIDGTSHGKPGHAAHYNTTNPIYKLIKDLQWFENYEFKKVSDTLGKVKMTVTQINAGKQHNVVPANCDFVVDVRINECYTNKEVFDIINQNTESELKARSFHLNSSSISIEHPIVKAGIKLGRKTYGSPTLSDQSVLNCESLKIGPGDSTRSHQANEYIYLSEIEESINIYIKLFNQIL